MKRYTIVRTNTFASVLKADGTLTVMAASTNGSAIEGCDVASQEATLTINEVSAIDDARLPALTSYPSPQPYDL